jgi:hypothetical protein
MAEMLTAGTPDEIAAVVTALENYGSGRVARTWAEDQMSGAASTSARNLLIENYNTDQYQGVSADDPRVMRGNEIIGERSGDPQESVLDRARRMGIGVE